MAQISGLSSPVGISISSDRGTPFSLGEINSLGGTFMDLTNLGDSPYYINFNDDGSKMFILGRYNQTIYTFNLWVNYDVTTAYKDAASLTVTAQ